ncbi:hypothetical protein [Actinopolymorpha sp. B9G3]|uniref:hypothetical protein n=1 Tax=Actinopolymorpha sp. B9G3 TaxID=3158970 RepID=UPI0032D90802
MLTGLRARTRTAMRTPLRTRGRRLALAVGAVGAAAVLAASFVADALLPPASARMPLTFYVDARIGNDAAVGRTPEEPLATFGEAVRRAEPGAEILLTGYGDRLTYTGTGTRCVTLAGKPDRPIVIRRNVYTNTLSPAVLTTDHLVHGGWKRRHGSEGGSRTWSRPWPRKIRLTGDPDVGFVKIGGIALTGYPRRPPASVDEAAWWEGGEVYARTSRADPNRYPVIVKDGDALCLSGKSRHVRIKDLMVVGAIHAVRIEPGAADIRIEHIVRENVLDADQRSGQPSDQPSGLRSDQPSGLRSDEPSGLRSDQPSGQPSVRRSDQPPGLRSDQSSGLRSDQPSGQPSDGRSDHLDLETDVPGLLEHGGDKQ